jgi:SAM-dependent methyltransferase
MHREPAKRTPLCAFFALAVGEEVPLLPEDLWSERLLDRFHLVQESQPRLREELISGFFDAIADQYRDLVEPQRNLENIERLVTWLVRDLRAGTGTLIDLGCGTGVSRPVVHAAGRSVIGIEAARGMRALAESAGMAVIGLGDVETLPIAEGAFASYVLHLDPMPRELPQLLGRLRDGASLVGNMHKSHGLPELRAYVLDIGAVLELGAFHPQHGRYVRIHAR